MQPRYRSLRAPGLWGLTSGMEMCSVLFLRLRTKKQPRQDSCLQEAQTLYVMQTTFKGRESKGSSGYQQPTMKTRSVGASTVEHWGHRVWALLLHAFPDNPEQMCSSSRGLNSRAGARPKGRTRKTQLQKYWRYQLRGRKPCHVSKLKHQETQPSNCLPMISLFPEGDGHQHESTPKQTQSLINERPHKPRLRASGGLLTTSLGVKDFPCPMWEACVVIVITN